MGIPDSPSEAPHQSLGSPSLVKIRHGWRGVHSTPRGGGCLQAAPLRLPGEWRSAFRRSPGADPEERQASHMGEAIAAFRQAALTVRRACDACFYSTPVGTETQHEWFAHFASIHAESMEDGYLSPVEYCEEMEQIRDIIEAELDEMEEAHDLLDDLPLLGRDEVQELAALHRVTVPKLRAMAKARGHKPSEDLLLPSPHTLRPSPELRHFAAEAVCDGIAWNAMATTAEAHINSLAKATEAIRHEASQHLTAMGDAWRYAGLEPHDPSSHFIAMVPELLSYAAEGRQQRDARYAAAMQRWRDAYFALAPFEESPTQAPPSANPAAAIPPRRTTKRKAARSNAGGGRRRKGNPKNVLHDLRAKYLADCRRLGRKPDSLRQWLCDWGTANDIDRKSVV